MNDYGIEILQKTYKFMLSSKTYDIFKECTNVTIQHFLVLS